MTKTEFVTELLKNYNDVAEEVPSESAKGYYVKKLSFTEGQLATLLYIVLNDKHVTWNENII